MYVKGSAQNNHNFVYAPSQWEMLLHCNGISHWLGPYTKLSLWRYCLWSCTKLSICLLVVNCIYANLCTKSRYQWQGQVITSHRFNTGSGNGLVPSGNKPLPEPMLTLFNTGLGNDSVQSGNKPLLEPMLTLWDVIIYPCPWYLLLAHKSSYDSLVLSLWYPHTYIKIYIAFGKNPKVGGSSPPKVETFSVLKTWTLSQEHLFMCTKMNTVACAQLTFQMLA